MKFNSGQQGLVIIIKTTEVNMFMLLSLFLSVVAFYREKYLRTDQNRGISIDLTHSFQII